MACLRSVMTENCQLSAHIFLELSGLLCLSPIVRMMSYFLNNEIPTCLLTTVYNQTNLQRSKILELAEGAQYNGVKSILLDVGSFYLSHAEQV